MPVGLLYFGTHHMPLIAASSATSRSTTIHVGSVVGQRHRDHLDAEVLADREVAVVAGHRAEKRDPRLARPRPRAVDRAREQRVGDGVVHQRQAGVVAEDHLGRRDAEERREQRAQLRQPLETRRSCGCRSRRRRGSRPRRAARADRWRGRAVRCDGLPRVRSSLRPRCLEGVVAALHPGVGGSEVGCRQLTEQGHSLAMVARVHASAPQIHLIAGSTFRHACA